MNEPIRRSGPPGRILLATDLSARCDRALDRAASLLLGSAAKRIMASVQCDALVARAPRAAAAS